MKSKSSLDSEESEKSKNEGQRDIELGADAVPYFFWLGRDAEDIIDPS